MDILDELSRKISMAGEGAVNRSRAFADLTRLNSAVTEEERRIDNAYFQIGKLYVALHPQDYEADFAVHVDSIIASQAKIDALKLQIQEIKGLTRCANCGAEVPNNIAFCSCCGAPMPRRAPALDENHKRCENCGAIVDKNLRFCTICGKPMVELSQRPAEFPAANAPAAVCPKCGAGIRNDSRFCAACGYSLEGGANDNPPQDQNSPQDSGGQRTCPSCGAVVEGDVAFCVDCGAPIN